MPSSSSPVIKHATGGTGGRSFGSAPTLSSMGDVDLTTNPPASGDTLIWNPVNNKWAPTGLSLPNLNDVNITAAADSQLLKYNLKGSVWENWTPDFYTKTEVDNKIGSAVSGLEHGLAVQSITNDPPGAPVADEVYIVGGFPTGAFVGHAHQLALWDGKAWVFSAAQNKEAHLVEDQSATYSWNGTDWVKVANSTNSFKPVAIGILNKSWGVETGYGIASVQAVPGRPFPGYWRVHLKESTTNWCFHCAVVSNSDGPSSWSEGFFASGHWVDGTTLDLYFHDAGNVSATVDPPKVSLIVY